tara:strand:+ start:681 stop:857 length:177 start_codon:yes stop_codon:yes gene_type:complete
MAKEEIEVQRTTTREGEIEKVELEVEKRDIRANLLSARKKQLLRKKRGYGRLPGSLRR